MTGRGLVKRYGHVTAINGADFDLYPRRGAGDRRRQRRRQVQPHQGPDGGRDPGRRDDHPGRQAGQVPLAGSRRATRASRRSTRPWPSRRLSTSPPTCSSGGRSAARGLLGQAAPARQEGDARPQARDELELAGDRHDPGHHPAGREPVRWPAPGGGGGAGGDVRQQGRHHGRADRRPRCPRDRAGPRADQADQRSRACPWC